jgi:Family of unknown function (DUF5677)
MPHEYARRMLEKRVGDLLTEVSVLAGGLGRGAVGEYPRHDLEVIGLFDRCRSMFGAIRLLLAHDFVHEAVLLGRPLFTDSLILAELAAADSKGRAELVVRWSLASLADFEGIYREARARGDEVDVELDQLAEQRKQLEAHARRQALKTRRWTPDEKQLAEQHGRADEYGAYRLTSHFVHGSTIAVSQRYTKAVDETVMVGGPAAQLEDWALDAGLFGAYSLLHASRAACTIFGWPEPSALDELLQRIDRLLAARAAD